MNTIPRHYEVTIAVPVTIQVRAFTASSAHEAAKVIVDQSAQSYPGRQRAAKTWPNRVLYVKEVHHDRNSNN